MLYYQLVIIFSADCRIAATLNVFALKEPITYAQRRVYFDIMYTLTIVYLITFISNNVESITQVIAGYIVGTK